MNIVSSERLWYLRAMARLLLSAVILLAFATSCGLTRNPPPTGKISVDAVSGNLEKKFAEPDAGLRGHKVSILNPADQSVIASGKTDDAGMVEFDLPEGTYTLVGARDEPQTVQLGAGQIAEIQVGDALVGEPVTLWSSQVVPIGRRSIGETLNIASFRPRPIQKSGQDLDSKRRLATLRSVQTLRSPRDRRYLTLTKDLPTSSYSFLLPLFELPPLSNRRDRYRLVATSREQNLR